jgi:hypothetical protein
MRPHGPMNLRFSHSGCVQFTLPIKKARHPAPGPFAGKRPNCKPGRHEMDRNQHR